MNHLRARRRLASLLDDFLEPEEEREVREHLAGCPRCRAVMDELEAGDALLSRVPAVMIPLAANRVGDDRLRALARWARPAPARPYRQLPAAGALVAALALTLFVAGSIPDPHALAGEESPRGLVMASMPSGFVVQTASFSESSGAFPAHLGR